MGLFDFVADFGKKLFSKPEDAPTKIKHELDEANLGLTDLVVGYKDGVVTLSGKSPSAEATEKAVLIAGNVQGVTSVEVSALTSPPLVAEVQYYTIEKGDNLSKIAKHFLGNANEYKLIFEANREVIKNPDLIYPGQKIRIPVN